MFCYTQETLDYNGCIALWLIDLLNGMEMFIWVQ